MAGRPVHVADRRTLADIRILKARGLSMEAIARELGMSRSTLYRLVGRSGEGR